MSQGQACLQQGSVRSVFEGMGHPSLSPTAPGGVCCCRDRVSLEIEYRSLAPSRLQATTRTELPCRGTPLRCRCEVGGQVDLGSFEVNSESAPVSTSMTGEDESATIRAVSASDDQRTNFSDPIVEPNGALDVGFVQEECNTSFDHHLLFQKSSNGGASFLPKAVQIDKPGQFMDFLDAAKDDTIPPTHFRAPNTPSITVNPKTGTLTYVYQNNINRPKSDADISFQQSSDGGLHWSNMRFLSTTPSGTPAPNDQFFPWITAASDGHLYAQWLDRRRDPNNVRINTWEAVSSNDGRTWNSRRISTQAWNPNLGFFTSGAFIGDYTGIAVSSTNVYPTWPDGRNTAIARTGIGDTNIFTDFEPR